MRYGDLPVLENGVYASAHILHDARSRFGLVFQNFNLFPHLTALENITLALRHVQGKRSGEAEEIGSSLLGRMGLAGREGAYPCELSGGQQQRVSNTALAKFEELKRLADARKPVRLVCSLEIYPKMVITAIDYDRDKDSGSAIRFSMTLRELKTVSLKSVTGTYDFQPDTIKTANDILIAANKKAGKRTAEEEDVYEAARQMKKSIGTEVTP